MRDHQAGEGDDGHEITTAIEGAAPADQNGDGAEEQQRGADDAAACIQASRCG